MHALLAPLLAQLVTLAVGDRVEGHYVLSQTKYFESSNTTTPGVALTLDWRRAELGFGYQPTFTVVPLEKTPRSVLLIHRAALDGRYRWRRTSLALSEAVSFGIRDLRREALAANQGVPNQTAAPDQQKPAPPPEGSGTGVAMPPAGGAGTGTAGTGAPAPNGAPANGATNPAVQSLAAKVRYGSFRSSASLDRIVSRPLSLRLTAGYTLAGGTDREAQRTLPLARGPDATASMHLALDGRNALTTSVTSQLIYSEDGGNAFVAALSQDYSHQFTRRTSSSVGAGVALTRSEPPPAPVTPGAAIALPLYSVYPTARASIGHTERLAHGMLAVSLSATAAPVLDVITTTIDPRLGGNFSTAWSRNRFSIGATAATALSLAPGSKTAFDSILTALTVRFNVGAGFEADGGVRGVWQKYGGVAVIQPSAVLFAGLGWGADVPLNPVHHPR
jgi:hypothetical protein